MDTRLDTRVAAMADRLDGRFALWAGAISPAVSEALERADRDRLIARLFSADPSLWSGDPSVQARIAHRLGWLGSPVQPVTLMKLVGVGVMIAGVLLATK